MIVMQVVDNQTIEPSTHRFKLCLYLYEEKKMKILELLTILAATFKTGNRQILKIQVLQLWNVSGVCIKCYQCASTEDQQKPTGIWSKDKFSQDRFEDKCGVYWPFQEERNIPVECNSDESHTPGINMSLVIIPYIASCTKTASDTWKIFRILIFEAVSSYIKTSSLLQIFISKWISP